MYKGVIVSAGFRYLSEGEILGAIFDIKSCVFLLKYKAYDEKNYQNKYQGLFVIVIKIVLSKKITLCLIILCLKRY